MRSILAHFLGEDPEATYDAGKYALGAQSSDASAPWMPSNITGASPPRLYGAPLPGGGAAPRGEASAQEAVPLGCWILPASNYEATGAQRQLRSDEVVPRVPQQIAVAQACIGAGNTVAEYVPETFLTPFDRAQAMVATGSLINTYTGEVASTFEDAMPPPDRTPGDSRRERKTSHLRLLAAEGNPRTTRRKREQENPLPAGDAGRAGLSASVRIGADVNKEKAERHVRDAYFNRTDMAPTEAQQTRNPFAFDGYNNRLRIQPFLPVTQELDAKQWTPNATLLPGSALPRRAATRLRADARPGRAGPAGCDAHLEPAAQIVSTIRLGSSTRNLEEQTTPGGGGWGAQFSGATVPQEQRPLAAERSQPSSGGYAHAPQADAPTICASAESVLGTLRGLGSSTPCLRPSAAASCGSAAAVAEVFAARDATAVSSRHANSQGGEVLCADLTGANEQDSLRVAKLQASNAPSCSSSAQEGARVDGGVAQLSDAGRRAAPAVGTPCQPPLPALGGVQGLLQIKSSETVSGDAPRRAASALDGGHFVPGEHRRRLPPVAIVEARGGASCGPTAAATSGEVQVREERRSSQRPAADALPDAFSAVTARAVQVSSGKSVLGRARSRPSCGVSGAAAATAARADARPEWLRASVDGARAEAAPCDRVSSGATEVRRRLAGGDAPRLYGQRGEGAARLAGGATTLTTRQQFLAPPRVDAEVGWRGQSCHGSQMLLPRSEELDRAPSRAEVSHGGHSAAATETEIGAEGPFVDAVVLGRRFPQAGAPQGAVRLAPNARVVAESRRSAQAALEAYGPRGQLHTRAEFAPGGQQASSRSVQAGLEACAPQGGQLQPRAETTGGGAARGSSTQAALEAWAPQGQVQSRAQREAEEERRRVAQPASEAACAPQGQLQPRAEAPPCGGEARRSAQATLEAWAPQGQLHSRAEAPPCGGEARRSAAQAALEAWAPQGELQFLAEEEEAELRRTAQSTLEAWAPQGQRQLSAASAGAARLSAAQAALEVWAPQGGHLQVSLEAAEVAQGRPSAAAQCEAWGLQGQFQVSLETLAEEGGGRRGAPQWQAGAPQGQLQMSPELQAAEEGARCAPQWQAWAQQSRLQLRAEEQRSGAQLFPAPQAALEAWAPQGELQVAQEARGADDARRYAQAALEACAPQGALQLAAEVGGGSEARRSTQAALEVWAPQGELRLAAEARPQAAARNAPPQAAPEAGAPRGELQLCAAEAAQAAPRATPDSAGGGQPAAVLSVTLRCENSAARAAGATQGVFSCSTSLAGAVAASRRRSDEVAGQQQQAHATFGLETSSAQVSQCSSVLPYRREGGGQQLRSASSVAGAAVPAAVSVSSLRLPQRASVVVDLAQHFQAVTGELEVLPSELYCSEQWRGGSSAELGGRKEASVFVSDLRGVHDSYRHIYALVGGDSELDPRHRFDPGVREWRQEFIVQPIAPRAEPRLNERGAMARLRTPTKRELRIVRSPKPTWRVRSGLVDSRMTEEVFTRCEEVVE